MSEIKIRQNDTVNLKYLATQRILYSRAKEVFGLQIICTVGLSVLFSFLKLIPKSKLGFDITGWIAVASILIAFADILFFNVYISKLRTYGAKVQELFDCNVFGLNWNAINSGSRPENHIIEENFERYVADPQAPLEDWYDINLEGLSDEKAILLCQETNIFYDTELRESFRRINVWCCILVFVVSLICSLMADVKLSEFIIMVLLPVLPVLVLTLKIVMENRKSLSASSEVKKVVMQIKAKAENPSMLELRQIQDRMFCSRKDSSLVPDWFYKRRRNRLEKAMKANAAQ